MRSYKNAKADKHEDPHHEHMAKNYKETPNWWYLAILVFSFVLGLIVVTTQNITLPVWAYIISLLLGIFISPLVRKLFSLDTAQL